MEEKYSAASISAELQGEKSKGEKLLNPSMRFIPFFGSVGGSFDSMHPGVLAEKYNRSYRPLFLWGRQGAASLMCWDQQITI